MNAPTIREIQLAVCARQHFSLGALIGRRRRPRLCRARHTAMYLARRLTPHSLTVIARHFGGRDHTTIMHGCRLVQKRVSSNQKTELAVARFIDELSAKAIKRTQGVLNQIDDPSVRKMLIMRWRERGEITDSETARLINDNALEAA